MENTDVGDKIIQSLKENKIDVAVNTLHNLKGSSANLGAIELPAILEKYEATLKNNSQGEYKELQDQFTQSLHILLDSIKEFHIRESGSDQA